MEKKLRGRPLKRDEDKLIGRRISMVKAAWDTIDLLCAKNQMTIEGLLYVTCAAMCIDDHNQTEDQEP
jgi:hypothetical protein